MASDPIGRRNAVPRVTREALWSLPTPIATMGVVTTTSPVASSEADAEHPTGGGSPDARAGERRGPGSPRRAAVVILITAVAIGAAIVATSVLVEDEPPAGSASAWFGTPIEPARDRPEFTLTDTEGNPFDFAAETGGQLTFLFFGYTNCPDICPVHLTTLNQALRAEPDLAARVVFVTTDPERDTPEQIRSWLDGFSPAYVGLTGSPSEVLAAQQAAGVTPAALEEAGEDGSYLVAHAAEIILITPDDHARFAYPFGTRQADWAADLRRLGQGQEPVVSP